MERNWTRTIALAILINIVCGVLLFIPAYRKNICLKFHFTKFGSFYLLRFLLHFGNWLWLLYIIHFTLDYFQIGKGLVVGIKLNLDTKNEYVFFVEWCTNSKSVEHIIPESLENKSHHIGKGNRMRWCNNYFARKLRNWFRKPITLKKCFGHKKNFITQKGRLVPTKTLFPP